MGKVSQEALKEAMQFFETLEKGVESAPLHTLQGTDSNGGEVNVENLLSKYTQKLQKAKESLTELDEISNDMRKSVETYSGIVDQLKKGEIPKDLPEDDDDDDEKAKEDEKKEKKDDVVEKSKSVDSSNNSNDVLLKGLQSLGTIIKAQGEQIESLNQAMNQPLGRRSAAGIQTLEKGNAANVLGEKDLEGKTVLSVTLQKAQVSNALYDLYSTTKEQRFADAVQSYESSGFIDPSVVASLKQHDIILRK